MEVEISGRVADSIECTCPTCENHILLPMDKEGERIKCRKCQTVFMVTFDRLPPTSQSIHLDHPILDGFLFGLGMALAAAMVGIVVWLLAYAIGPPFTSKKNRVAEAAYLIQG